MIHKNMENTDTRYRWYRLKMWRFVPDVENSSDWDWTGISPKTRNDAVTWCVCFIYRASVNTALFTVDSLTTVCWCGSTVTCTITPCERCWRSPLREHVIEGENTPCTFYTVTSHVRPSCVSAERWTSVSLRSRRGRLTTERSNWSRSSQSTSLVSHCTFSETSTTQAQFLTLHFAT